MTMDAKPIRQAFFAGDGKIRIVERDLPRAGPGEVLLRVRACALCGSDLRPLRNSHIIPEFMYKAIYDDKHRHYLLSSLSGDADSGIQKGFREPLLCEVC